MNLCFVLHPESALCASRSKLINIVSLLKTYNEGDVCHGSYLQCMTLWYHLVLGTQYSLLAQKIDKQLLGKERS